MSERKGSRSGYVAGTVHDFLCVGEVAHDLPFLDLVQFTGSGAVEGGQCARHVSETSRQFRRVQVCPCALDRGGAGVAIESGGEYRQRPLHIAVGVTEPCGVLHHLGEPRGPSCRFSFAELGEP